MHGNNKKDLKFRRAVGRVLIALSFKSFKRNNELLRRNREKSDCSEAFILPVVEEERGSQQDEELKDSWRNSSVEEEEDEVESSLEKPRRGRRQAICDSKSIDVEAEELSSASGEASHNAFDQSGDRRKTTTDQSSICHSLSNPTRKQHIPLLKRNTIADFATNKAHQDSCLFSDQDKKKASFLIQKLREKKTSKNCLPLSHVLLSLKPSHFQDAAIIKYKKAHWLELIKSKLQDNEFIDSSRQVKIFFNNKSAVNNQNLGINEDNLSSHDAAQKTKEKKISDNDSDETKIQNDTCNYRDNLIVFGVEDDESTQKCNTNAHENFMKNRDDKNENRLKEKDDKSELCVDNTNEVEPQSENFVIRRNLNKRLNIDSPASTFNKLVKPTNSKPDTKALDLDSLTFDSTLTNINLKMTFQPLMFPKSFSATNTSKQTNDGNLFSANTMTKIMQPFSSPISSVIKSPVEEVKNASSLNCFEVSHTTNDDLMSSITTTTTNTTKFDNINTSNANFQLLNPNQFSFKSAITTLTPPFPSSPSPSSSPISNTPPSFNPSSNSPLSPPGFFRPSSPTNHNILLNDQPRAAKDTERRRKEAVWELFKSEVVFLTDHLMALKHCFMEPLKKVQVEGHLMFAEPSQLFGNLDELCYASYTFSRDFINLLLNVQCIEEFGSNQVLLKALKRFCQLTRDGEIYHEYCLNYSTATTHLELLRRNDDFIEFEKWCERDPRCHRLQLGDLLISPMQHCTKMPLLLNNIRRYTENPNEQFMLTGSLQKLEASLESLEAKMSWLRNYERMQEVFRQTIWQSITELEPRTYVPDFLKATLSRQPCERLLSSVKRKLLFEGPLYLIEISKIVDMYMFLFDDILLLTKVKKSPRKRPSTSDPYSPYQRVHTTGAIFQVHRQPIPLDRFSFHDIKAIDQADGPMEGSVDMNADGWMNASVDSVKDSCLPHLYDDCSPSSQKSNLLFGCVSTASALKNAFVIIQVNRFQQIIGVFTLQAPNYSAKLQWMMRLHEAQEAHKEWLKGGREDEKSCGKDIWNKKKKERSQNRSQELCEFLTVDTSKGRNLRSCSSDATVALKNEISDEASKRRISDPIVQFVDVTGEAGAKEKGTTNKETVVSIKNHEDTSHLSEENTQTMSNKIKINLEDSSYVDDMNLLP